MNKLLKFLPPINFSKDTIFQWSCCCCFAHCGQNKIRAPFLKKNVVVSIDFNIILLTKEVFETTLGWSRP